MDGALPRVLPDPGNGFEGAELEAVEGDDVVTPGISSVAITFPFLQPHKYQSPWNDEVCIASRTERWAHSSTSTSAN